MNLLNNINKTLNLRENGKWFKLYGCDFKIASIKSKSCIKALMDNKINSIADKNDELMKIVVSVLIKDWKGIEVDGKELEFNEENKKILLEKDEFNNYIYDAVLEDIINIANGLERKEIEYIYESVKN